MRVLKIQNVILIESAEIHFGDNLNILTGETGSGKSAILSAIRLIAGERADQTLLRKGSERAVVEAEFAGQRFIRREIYRSGKNRCFIDDEQVSLSALKEAVQIEMVDQNSTLLSQEKNLLDLFAKIETEGYEQSLAEEKKLIGQLEQWMQIPKEKELDWAQKDLALIEDVGLKPGEEETLIEEQNFLGSIQQIAEKIEAVNFTLTEGPDLPNLRRAFGLLESCVRFDGKLQEVVLTMKTALVELNEVAHFIQSYQEKLNADPKRLEAIENRLSAIISLKRRFGTDIEGQKKKLIDTIDHLTGLEAQIETLKKTYHTLRNKNEAWAQAITAKRKEAAPLLSQQILQELKSLNLPHAQFSIRVGEAFNDVQFLFSANPGHPPIPIEQCASGGELSRLLLAIKMILSEGKSTLIFDEIDSNVGGQTAAILGEKLKKLSEKRQVICVTHFVQVARCAIDHFFVSKEAKDESTYTSVKKLNEKEKQIEYNRMLGTV